MTEYKMRRDDVVKVKCSQCGRAHWSQYTITAYISQEALEHAHAVAQGELDRRVADFVANPPSWMCPDCMAGGCDE